MHFYKCTNVNHKITLHPNNFINRLISNANIHVNNNNSLHVIYHNNWHLLAETAKICIQKYIGGKALACHFKETLELRITPSQNLQIELYRKAFIFMKCTSVLSLSNTEKPWILWYIKTGIYLLQFKFVKKDISIFRQVSQLTIIYFHKWKSVSPCSKEQRMTHVILSICLFNYQLLL